MLDRISYSTLTVTYYEKTSALYGFPSKFGGAIKNGWDFLLMFIVAVTNLWAFILLGIVAYLLARWLANKKKKG